MKMGKYTIEKYGNTKYYTLTDKNRKGESLVIEILWCDRGNHDKKYFPKKWLSVHTHCTDSEGNCYCERYNPFMEKYSYGLRLILSKIMEATEENERKAVDSIVCLFESAQGKSATDLKMEKCKAFAKSNNLEIVTEKPEGWYELFGISSPAGSIVITNKKTLRQKEYKKALFVY